MRIKSTKAISPTGIALLLFACCVATSGAVSKRAPDRVSGCELLQHPAKYNGHQIEVDGLVYSDFEHFDLRFPCSGYLNLELSTTPKDLEKYGFNTIQDEESKKLDGLVGQSAAEMFGPGKRARVRVIGLFRCHYDFPDCKNLSKFGDSSIVVLLFRNVRPYQ